MNEDLYIVGLGASAGGNDALLEFFRNVPENPGVAFVVIRHLSRIHKSYFPEMLKRVTDLQVVEVERETEVNPNTIYLLPGKFKMILSEGKLRLIKRPLEEKINYSINEFFHSLAEDAGKRAIGIILSGYLDDGAEGAKHIESKGGIIIVQHPDSAKTDSMPMNVIKRDHPDYILAPAEMPKAILDYIKTQSVSDRNLR